MERLRTIRKELGLTQKEVAETIGLKQGSICLYENGHRTPTADMIKKFAQAYGVSSDYLLGLTDDHGSISCKKKMDRQLALHIREMLKDDQAKARRELDGIIDADGNAHDALEVYATARLMLTQYEEWLEGQT